MKVFGPYKATVANIHDGDTIRLDVLLLRRTLASRPNTDLGFNIHSTAKGIVLEWQAVRLYGCNAPEIATTDGKAALTFLGSLVKVGDTVSLLSHGWDKYGGRILGSVTLADGTDLVSAMIASGHAKPWDGQGVKPTLHT